jgi:hypothetical protein
VLSANLPSALAIGSIFSSLVISVSLPSEEGRGKRDGWDQLPSLIRGHGRGRAGLREGYEHVNSGEKICRCLLTDLDETS